MRNLNYHVLDVFTATPYHGNPLAVVEDDRGLSDDRMQKIASEFNLSETVFVRKCDSDAATRELRIFTPKRELPFAGHPLVGTASLLALQEGKKDAENAYTFKLPSATIDMTATLTGANVARAGFRAPITPATLDAPLPNDELAKSLNIQPLDILTDHDYPMLVNGGGKFLFVPVRNKDALKRCSPNFSYWDGVIGALDHPAVYAFTYLTHSPKNHLNARCFAPALGILEDPATGSAVCAFAGYLNAISKQPNMDVVKNVEQGFDMGRPSIITLSAESKNLQIKSIRISGNSVLVANGQLMARD